MKLRLMLAACLLPCNLRSSCRDFAGELAARAFNDKSNANLFFC